MNELFLKNFDFESNGFFDPVPFKDVKVGFNVKKKIGPKNHLSYFKIYITNNEFEKNSAIKSLTIRISHGKLDEDGSLVVASTDWKRPLFGPIDLISENDFFYNIKTNEFFKKNKKIDGNKLLKQAERLHTKATRPWGGLRLRIELVFWRIILRDLMKFISNFFVWILNVRSGKKYSYEIFERLVKADKLEETIKDNENQEEKKNLNIFGYNISPWVFVIYSAIHLIVYAIFWAKNYRPKIIITIFENNFLTTIYVLFTIIILEFILNRISENFLKKIIKKTSITYFNLSAKKIKI